MHIYTHSFIHEFIHDQDYRRPPPLPILARIPRLPRRDDTGLGVPPRASVQAWGFRGLGFGFRFQGFRVVGFMGLRIYVLRDQGLGSRASVQGLGFGFKVLALGAFGLFYLGIGV